MKKCGEQLTGYYLLNMQLLAVIKYLKCWNAIRKYFMILIKLGKTCISKFCINLVLGIFFRDVKCIFLYVAND